eukprot:3964812-Prorocentrum_lima.AAC.1
MEPITDRIMRITLSSVMPITIICICAPIAMRSDEEKKGAFHDRCSAVHNPGTSRGPTFIAGDFNTR